MEKRKGERDGVPELRRQPVGIAAMIPVLRPSCTEREIAAVAEIMANFRAFMDSNTTGERKDDVDWKRGQRDGFEDAQRKSPNKGLHMTPYGLSQLSKRVTGERDE